MAPISHLSDNGTPAGPDESPFGEVGKGLAAGASGRLARWLLLASLLVPLAIAVFTAWGARLGWYRGAAESAVQVVLGIGAFGLVGLTAAVLLGRSEARRRAAEAELQRQQQQSEGLVAQRTQALREAESRYHGLFDRLPIGLYRTTPAGRVLEVNPALARMLGYADANAVLEADVTETFCDVELRRRWQDRIAREGAVQGFEVRLRRTDGTLIWVLENSCAVYDAQGWLLYYEGSMEDITERKRADAQLRDSEQLYRSLVDVLPQNVFRKDLRERFTFVSQSFCRALGRTELEILGKTDFDLYPPELAAKYQQDDRTVLASGLPFEAVEEHRAPNGALLYVQVVKTPLRDASGNTVGLQGIFWDVTDRTRAEPRQP